MPSSSEQGEGRLKNRWEVITLHQTARSLLAPPPQFGCAGKGEAAAWV